MLFAVHPTVGRLAGGIAVVNAIWAGTMANRDRGLVAAVAFWLTIASVAALEAVMLANHVH